MRTRRGLGTLVVAGIAIGACGGESAPPGGLSTRRDVERDKIAATVLELVDVHSIGGDEPVVPTVVIDDALDVAAYPGWFAAAHADTARTIADVLGSAPPTRDTVIVAATIPLDCDEAEGARLLARGSDLAVEPTGVDQYPTCEIRHSVVALLAVARADLPAEPTVDGAPIPDRAGPGALLTLVPLGPGEWRVPPADLADKRAAKAFAGALPPAAAATVWAAATAHADVRLPAFVLPGCENEDAVLIVTEPEIRAELVVRAACVVPEWFVVVFGLDATLYPDGARLAA